MRQAVTKTTGHGLLIVPLEWPFLTAIQRSRGGPEVIPNLEYGFRRQPDVIVLAKNQLLGAEKDAGTNTGDCHETVGALYPFIGCLGQKGELGKEIGLIMPRVV